MKLSAKQQAIMECIALFNSTLGRAPAIFEIAKALDWRYNATQKGLTRLENKGLIKRVREPGRRRTHIEIVEPST